METYYFSLIIQWLMVGLYPPSGYMKWNKDLDWQPIPVHTVPLLEDYFLRSDHTVCPKLMYLREEAVASDTITNALNQNK